MLAEDGTPQRRISMRITNLTSKQAPRITLLFIMAVASISLLQPTAKADSIAYMVLVPGDNNPETLGTIDLDTGVFTQIALIANNQQLAGLGEVNGNLYSGDGNGFGGSAFFQVNETNGSFTTLGAASIVWGGIFSTSTGVFSFASIPANLSQSLSELYSVNPATGATTLVGPTGLDTAGANGYAQSTGANVLYVAVGFPGYSVLYSLDPDTGASTLIGDTGIVTDSMVFEDGILYATDESDHIYSLNTTTGAAMFITDTSGSSDGLLAPFETPQSVATPQPSSLLMLGTGLLGLLAIVRRTLAV
jgi:hypothetical protein